MFVFFNCNLVNVVYWDNFCSCFGYENFVSKVECFVCNVGFVYFVVYIFSQCYDRIMSNFWQDRVSGWWSQNYVIFDDENVFVCIFRKIVINI